MARWNGEQDGPACSYVSKCPLQSKICHEMTVSIKPIYKVRRIALTDYQFRKTDSNIMADKEDKWPENIVGQFYVDEQCIDCDLCRETAPDFFTRNEDGGYSFVFKQPTTQEEIDQCMEALEGCPVEAIGDDGNE
jgi:ferredoxin